MGAAGLRRKFHQSLWRALYAGRPKPVRSAHRQHGRGLGRGRSRDARREIGTPGSVDRGRNLVHRSTGEGVFAVASGNQLREILDRRTDAEGESKLSHANRTRTYRSDGLLFGRVNFVLALLAVPESLRTCRLPFDPFPLEWQIAAGEWWTAPDRT